MVRSVNLNEVEPFILSLLQSAESSVRQKMRAYAQDHGIVIR